MSITLVGAATPVYLAGAASGTVTVPVGVTTSHLGIIQTTSSVAGTVDIGATGWVQRYENPAGQSNHEVAVFTRLGGYAAGDTFSVSQSLSHNVRVTAVWLDTGGRDVTVFGTVGARNAVSSANTVIPGITLTALTQEVLVLGTERTTADGTTPSAFSPVTPTQLYFQEFPADTDSSHYIGWFTPTSTSVGSLTISYSASSGNGTGVMMALAEPAGGGAPALTGSADFSGTGTLTATGTASQAPTASFSWQSNPSTSVLSLGYMINGGTTVQAIASLASDLSSPILGTSTTRPSSGWCNSQISGLNPGTTYYTGVRVDGVLLATGRGTYKTLKAGVQASKIIASSCNNTGSAHAVFTRIKTEAPDFFAHMGDIHYANLTSGIFTDAAWRSAFTSSVTSSTFGPLLAEVPMTYDPDNHDGPGTSLGFPDGVWDTAVSTAVRNLTGEIYAAPTKGFYKTWTHAGVRYIELDRWSFRSDPAAADSSSKTMLGAAQKAWFLNLLQTATEPAIVVLAGFPHYSNLIAGGRWGNYPTERVEIGNAITALSSAQRSKIIFLGGDSHSINADDGTNAMWGRPSLNASPLDQAGGLATGTWNIANIDVPDSRGYFARLTFTPVGSNLNMTWEAVQDDGVVMATWSTSFPLTQSYSDTASFSGTGTLVATGRPAMVGTASFSGSGTLTAAAEQGLVGSASFSGVGTLTAVGAVGIGTPPVSTSWRFLTPVEEIPILLEPRTHLYGSLRYGKAVWRVDGQWDQGLEPSAQIVAAADRFYAGGRIHTVTETQRDELIAGGFGLYITSEETT